ncbi:hypothetical protein GIB67_035244 [Kingdonia uniflora]|uniref:peptidylprolyl isomerase n=1 Tax=Kingdonia uniflora TaxID=39325 RepID=A0A7J7KXU5_9MAGN|nr:hypothetical protein GIB67_035244 [Kingdonia uniflora]
MSSATSFAVGCSQIPPKSAKTIRTKPNVITVSAQQSQPVVVVVKPEKGNLSLIRREAIGFGLLMGLMGANPLTVLAAETEECKLVTIPSGLGFCDKVVGYGPEASKGQLIKAHYVGKLENGKIFDSSYNRGKPLAFRVGVGEVIKGWDQGILGAEGMPPMLAGGKRTLKLPPEFGYGMRGAGCKGGSCIIPPNSFLLFDVEFIGKA